MSENIKVLLIDEAPDIYDLFQEVLNKYISYYDINYGFELYYASDENHENFHMEYDMYICDDSFGGISRSKDILKTIRANDENAIIFIMSGVADDKLLQDLINLRIHGFIDKDEFDLEPFIATAKSIASFKNRVEELDKKLGKLNSLV